MKNNAYKMNHKKYKLVSKISFLSKMYFQKVDQIKTNTFAIK